MVDRKLIEKIKKHVEEEYKKEANIFGVGAYEYHFKNVVRCSKIMAKILKADEEIVEIAAWLHDIGSIHGHHKDHHIYGSIYAEKLLKKYNYPKEKIENVKHCIFVHRGSKRMKKLTKEAECLADADAMAHFSEIAALFYLAYSVKKLDVEEAKKFIKEKLERDWKKITPTAKKVIKPEYEMAKKLLK